MGEAKKEPIYLKPWFLITAGIILFIVLGNIISKEEHKQQKFSISTYNAMSTDQQRNYLNDFVVERKSKLKRIVEDAVSNHLKAPSEADFNDDISFSVDQYLTRQILAQGTVDAPNSFGVKIRSTYRCRFAIANEDGDIEIQKVAIDE